MVVDRRASHIQGNIARNLSAFRSGQGYQTVLFLTAQDEFDSALKFCTVATVSRKMPMSGKCHDAEACHAGLSVRQSRKCAIGFLLGSQPLQCAVETAVDALPLVVF